MTAEAAETVPVLEQLLAEWWPDGSFGGARPTHPDGTPRRPDPLAAEHYAALAEACGHQRLTPRTRPALPVRTRKAS